MLGRGAEWCPYLSGMRSTSVCCSRGLVPGWAAELRRGAVFRRATTPRHAVTQRIFVPQRIFSSAFGTIARDASRSNIHYSLVDSHISLSSFFLSVVMSQTQTTTVIAPTLTLSGLDDTHVSGATANRLPSGAPAITTSSVQVNETVNTNADHEVTTYPPNGAASDRSDTMPTDPHAPEMVGQGLSGTAAALIMTPLCLSVVLSSLDLTIVTPAIPAIVASFASPAGYIWIGGAFILANTAITPVWGSVADIWGRKPVMLSALAIFLAGSLLCAVAPDVNALIAGRAVQGLGAAGLSTMVNVIVCDSFSLRDRGLYLAITSIVWAVGTSVGPVLGGLFTTRLQ